MSYLVYIVIVLSTFTGGAVCGITGFGVGIVFQAIWNTVNNNIDLHLNEIDSTITPLQTSLSIVACVFPFNTARIAYDMYKNNTFQHIQYNIVIASLITLLPSSVAGTYLLVHINNDTLKRMLGCTFFIFALYQIVTAIVQNYNAAAISNTTSIQDTGHVNGNTKIQYIAIQTSEHDTTTTTTPQRTYIQSIQYWICHRHTLYAFCFGTLAGLLSGSFGTGGPPLMMLFSILGLTGSEIRATSMATSIFSQTMLLINCMVFGIIHLSQWKLYATSIAVILFGTSLGNSIHHKVNTAQIVLVLQFLILLSTIPLLQPNTETTFGVVAIIGYCTVILLSIIGVVVVKLRQRTLNDSITPYQNTMVK